MTKSPGTPAIDSNQDSPFYLVSKHRRLYLNVNWVSSGVGT